ncbi:MAG: hypothetical protein M3010_04010 [Candidatus Dormibacteraeota bacterium]|nr:hypothetical protein [Candidatus Dormibacteraeota bacterium]
MIQAKELTATPRVPSTGAVPARETAGLDIERFADALTMLELYVDGMLAATELPAMDPWVDDQVMDARLASF